jgi:hypothetical protein
MRVIANTRPGIGVELIEMAAPKPRERELLIKVVACGVVRIWLMPRNPRRSAAVSGFAKPGAEKQRGAVTFSGGAFSRSACFFVTSKIARISRRMVADPSLRPHCPPQKLPRWLETREIKTNLKGAHRQ